GRDPEVDARDRSGLAERPLQPFDDDRVAAARHLGHAGAGATGAGMAAEVTPVIGATRLCSERKNHTVAAQTAVAPAMWNPTSSSGMPLKYWMYPIAACATTTASSTPSLRCTDAGARMCRTT